MQSSFLNTVLYRFKSVSVAPTTFCCNINGLEIRSLSRFCFAYILGVSKHHFFRHILPHVGCTCTTNRTDGGEVMRVLSYSEVRENFKSVIDQTIDDADYDHSSARR